MTGERIQSGGEMIMASGPMADETAGMYVNIGRL